MFRRDVIVDLVEMFVHRLLSSVSLIAIPSWNQVDLVHGQVISKHWPIMNDERRRAIHLVQPTIVRVKSGHKKDPKTATILDAPAGKTNAAVR